MLSVSSIVRSFQIHNKIPVNGDIPLFSQTLRLPAIIAPEGISEGFGVFDFLPHGVQIPFTSPPGVVCLALSATLATYTDPGADEGVFSLVFYDLPV